MSNLQSVIDTAFERRSEINPASASAEVKSAVAEVLNHLNAGTLRCAEKING